MKKNQLKEALQEAVEGNDLSDRQMKKIIAKYTARIVIPRQKNISRFILCPVGLVGAGKTTVLKPLSRKLSLVRISTDEIRMLLRKKGFNFVRISEIGAILIDMYLKLGHSLALDADCISPNVQKNLKTISRKTGSNLIWIHIKAPEKSILHNLKYRPGGILGNAKQAIASYKRRKPLHQKYASRRHFDYTFDTSKSDLKNQINEFAKNIQERYGM